MLFNSFKFIWFFAVVFALYWSFSHKGQNRLLLVASYVFYGWWDWRFLSLLMLSTGVDFVLAKMIEDSSSIRLRRRLLVTSMCVSLTVLGFFKYFNFFVGSMTQLLMLMGINASSCHLDVILPWGISFYTFQTMNYTIDVYRGHLKASRKLGEFAVFVSFWPHLIAGPIMRATVLLQQVQRRRQASYEMFRTGAWLILFGYYKKVVLADNMAPFVNQVFNEPTQTAGFAVLAGLLAFAFQIYGDFSGYSDIARGLARFMGFELMVNFRRPYFAVNPSDFWRRWHISLSTWLRDYLYIPLGGNRHGTVRTCRNLSITMLLGGLWHGAHWHFVIWGAYHGLLLVVQRLWPFRLGYGAGREAFSPPRIVRWTQTIAFFTVTLVGWLIFRVNRLADIPVLIHQFFKLSILTGKTCMLTILVLTGPVLWLEWLQERTDNEMVVKTWPWWGRLLTYGVLWGGIVLSGVTDSYEFIYFQF